MIGAFGTIERLVGYLPRNRRNGVSVALSIDLCSCPAVRATLILIQRRSMEYNQIPYLVLRSRVIDQL
ncbi:hypothetical protein AB1N83_003438 [Pleurotus pulmonarius]